ncbi:MAG: hypothetical protein GXP49_18120 [Deltaproteobacteria bacterium]|nr:hypothetical protein [Deltaproteobacteria bacterium]
MIASLQVFHLLSIGLCAFIWGFMYAQRRNDPVNEAFRLYVINELAWDLLEFVYYSPLSYGFERILQRAISFFWIPIGFWFLNFVYALLRRKKDMLYWLTAGAVIAGLILDNFTELGTRGWIRHGWGVANIRGPLHTLVLTNLAALPCLIGVFLLFNAYIKRSVPGIRKPVKLIMLGTLIVLALTWLVNVYIPNIMGYEQFPRIGSAGTSLFHLFIMFLILKYDFMSLSPSEVASGLFEGSKDGIVLLDRHTNVLRTNPAIERMFPVLAEAQGLPIANYISLPKGTGEFRNFELAVDFGPGKQYFSLSRSNKLVNERIYSSLIIAHDITRQVRARMELKRSAEEAEKEVEARTKELQKAQKLEAVGILAGSVVHDFNNIIFAIMGQVEYLNDLRFEDPGIKDDLDAIREAIDNCAGVGREILGFSRKDVSKDESFELYKLLEKVKSIIKVSMPSSILLDIKWPDRNLRLNGNLHKVQQAILNICTNAYQAMPSYRGVVKIRSRTFIVDESYAGAHPALKPGSYVVVSIVDNGEGMSDAVRKLSLEPFFSTREGASGLGLPTAMRIIRSISGTMQIESNPGIGTRVDVFLPVAHSPE